MHTDLRTIFVCSLAWFIIVPGILLISLCKYLFFFFFIIIVVGREGLWSDLCTVWKSRYVFKRNGRSWIWGFWCDWTSLTHAYRYSKVVIHPPLATTRKIAISTLVVMNQVPLDHLSSASFWLQNVISLPTHYNKQEAYGQNGCHLQQPHKHGPVTASVSNVFHFDGRGEQEEDWHCAQLLALKDLALQETVKEMERGGLASEPG